MHGMVIARMFELHRGDCLDILRTMPEASVDSIVTDPPYGLAFMGKRWDYDVPSVEIWEECLRVLKPGGHLLAFAGTRTQHRMAVRIEDAGFEIRDMIAWVYGSGFPKSLDVSKSIDQAAGVERTEESPHPTNECKGGQWCKCYSLDATGRYRPTKHSAITAPATDAARQWNGWGTALKPALEPITVARKPLAGTVAANVLMHGTGALNVDGCRIGTGADKGIWPITQRRHSDVTWTLQPVQTDSNSGRWPANLIHDGSDEVVELFPECKSGKPGDAVRTAKVMVLQGGGNGTPLTGFGDSGSAARFFYCAKASAEDRGPGNHHPTVKPTDLMRYLCRLVTPLDGVVLDPFTGSGSTGRGAVLEGFAFIGCEMDPEYLEIARTRILAAERAYQPCLKLS